MGIIHTQINYHKPDRTKISKRSRSLITTTQHLGEGYHQKQRIILLNTHKSLILVNQKRRHKCKKRYIEYVMSILSILFV